MILSASEIERALESGDLVLDPFERACLKPASYLLRLGDWFIAPSTGGIVDVGIPAAAGTEPTPARADVWDLDPGGFALGCTIEAIRCGPHLLGILSDLSHHGRLGLSAHGGSQFVSPGFGFREATPLTLELTNRGGNILRLRPGLPIVHLALVRVEGDILTEQLPLAISAYEGATAPSGACFEAGWPARFRRTNPDGSG